MSRTPADFDYDAIVEASVQRKRSWSIQFVWIVPIVAALVGGWLVVKSILEKGPTITISFKSAEGLEAGKTKVKYKNVDIGDVKTVKLSRERQGVIATVELAKEAESYLVEDTRFWVVRPRVAGGQVSGLGTLFSGSYIGLDIGKSQTARREFIGLEAVPVVTADIPGRQFILHAETLGSLDIGSPVFFRQEAVGSIMAHELNKDGRGVTFKIFVNSPYDQYVTSDTRFWNVSGIDVTVDATGIRIDTQSLASILIGGVAFESPVASASLAAAEENRQFSLFNNRNEAMKRADTISVPATLYFKNTIRGLSVGAPVEFRGIVIGEVKSMGVEFDESQVEFRFPVGIAIYPGRLMALMVPGAQEVKMDQDSRRARWDLMVARGLRGQLRTGNLLTGQLYVAMDFFPGAPAAKVDWTKTPPILPTIPGTFEEIQETLARLAKKIDEMPLDEIGGDVRQTLRTLTRTLDSGDQLVKRLHADVTPEAKSALEEARKTLKAAERTLSSNSPMQHELQETLRELGRTAQSMRVLSDYLERHPESLIRGKK
jgi:paraquat-inducible protein B